MISVANHINKLDALRKYMEVFVEYKHACRIYLASLVYIQFRRMSFEESKKVYDQTGMIWYEKKIELDKSEVPTRLPDFETWYNLYLITNN